MIGFGSTELAGVYLGTTRLSRVYVGDAMVWQDYREESGTYTADTSYIVPDWANFVDLIGVGGGSSGCTGNGGNTQFGNGGMAGVWNAVTLQRGVHFSGVGVTLTIDVGAGGAQAANSDGARNNGSGTKVSIGGTQVFEALPGTNSNTPGDAYGDDQDGASPGNYIYRMIEYPGGSGGTGNAGAGSPAGGAGAGGNGGIFGSRTRGGPGARGQLWQVSRSS